MSPGALARLVEDSGQHAVFFAEHTLICGEIPDAEVHPGALASPSPEVDAFGRSLAGFEFDRA
jgi:hypothetical protein